MGVAVQTHWFAVGGIVPWTEAGVGVVATQANVNVAYGTDGLRMLREGVGASEAVRRLVAGDPNAAGRQLAILEANGSVGTFTGPECFEFAGHLAGDGWSCQANMMASPDVWPSMAQAFQQTRGELANRLIAALHAGESAGGDIRGRQSAAIEVVAASGEPSERLLSLRVDDHHDPLGELDRLYGLHRAYELAGQGDEALGRGAHFEASELYERASELAPGNHELLFWSGLGAAQAGRVKAGAERVSRAIAQHAGWADFLQRLPETAFPSVRAVREHLSSGSREAGGGQAGGQAGGGQDGTRDGGTRDGGAQDAGPQDGG